MSRLGWLGWSDLASGVPLRAAGCCAARMPGWRCLQRCFCAFRPHFVRPAPPSTTIHTALHHASHHPSGDDPNFRGRGNRSSGDLFSAAPNIDHSQEFVKRDLQGALPALLAGIGVAARCHAGDRLPEEPGSTAGRNASQPASRTHRLTPPTRMQSGWCGCARMWASTAGASTLSRASMARTSRWVVGENVEEVRA